MAKITAEACVGAFMHGWVSRFGPPSQIISDRGSQFVSTLWAAFGRTAGFTPAFTTAYHPQANGMVERFHRTLKDSIRAQNKESWISALPLTLLHLRATPREDLNGSPAQHLYGQGLSLPGDFLPDQPSIEPGPGFVRQVRDAMDGNPPPPPAHAPVKSTPSLLEQLKTCERVYVREEGVQKSSAPKYHGPYRVIRPGDKVFYLETPGNIHPFISVDRLKPAFNLPE